MAFASAPTPSHDQPDVPAEPSVESRSRRRSRHGRRVRLYVWAGLFVAAFAVLVVLSSVNTNAVKLGWVFGSTNASLIWIILAAAILGWLLGLTTAVVFHHKTRRPT
jgi:uncharacterized integral membrane protein